LEIKFGIGSNDKYFDEFEQSDESQRCIVQYLKKENSSQVL